MKAVQLCPVNVVRTVGANVEHLSLLPEHRSAGAFRHGGLRRRSVRDLRLASDGRWLSGRVNNVLVECAEF
jgi:hypothetical protein